MSSQYKPVTPQNLSEYRSRWVTGIILAISVLAICVHTLISVQGSYSFLQSLPAPSFKQLDLSDATWIVREGFAAEHSTGVKEDQAGALSITGLPIRLNHLFTPRSNQNIYQYTASVQFFLGTNDLQKHEPLALMVSEIGENWEIYLNGTSIRREIYLNQQDQIEIHRTLQGVIIYLPQTLIRAGSNTLVFHLIESRQYNQWFADWYPGVSINSGIVIDRADRLLSVRAIRLMFSSGVVGITLFFGLYHLLLATRRASEPYYLFFGLTLLCQALYSISQSPYNFAPVFDTSLLTRISYVALIGMSATVGPFLWFFLRPGWTLPRLIGGYTALETARALATLFAPTAWIDVPMRLYIILLIPFWILMTVLVIRAIVDQRPDAGKVFIVMVITFVMSIWDMLDTLFFHSGIRLLAQWGPLIVTIAMASILADRSWRASAETERLNRALEEKNAQLEQSRNLLENQVEARTRELLEANTRLAHVADQARASSRAKSVFLANMSHEIRTPLNAILGFAQILSRDTGFLPRQREQIAIIQRSGEHLLALINDVLDLSKIEAGKMTLQPGQVDLPSLLRQVIDLFSWRASDKGLVLRFEPGSTLPHQIMTDQGKLRQILINLLSNAVKFTQRGRVVLRARLLEDANVQEPLARILFEVEDSGPGMNADDLTHLFSAFSQAEAGLQSHEGTGLGLVLSREHARLLGGELMVISNPGIGSRFQFTIVAPILPKYRSTSTSMNGTILGFAPGQPQRRLLVVDDLPVGRTVLVELIKSLPGSDCFEIRQANNGHEALAIWENWKPDLVFSDLRMPGMDGLELTRRIKQQAREHHTMVVAITASVFSDERQAVLSAGCDDFLCKPLQAAQMYDTLARLIHVQLIYDQAPTQELVSIEQISDHVRLQSQAWVSALRKATMIGDFQRASDLIMSIQETDPWLTKQLLQIAEQFDHDRLLRVTAVEQHVGERSIV